LDVLPTARHPASGKTRGDLMLKHHTWVSGLLDAKWAWGCYLLSNVVNSVLFSCILVVEHVSNMNHEYPYEHPPEEKTKNILNISSTTKNVKSQWPEIFDCRDIHQFRQ
jgi:hypothetical protein